MITIKDIAKEANVSEGTVDRVLHNRGGVSKKTEDKIKGILKKYNFKANPVARALAMKSRFKILTLIPNFDDNNIFWKSPYLGILKASTEVSNYGVEVDTYLFDQFDANSYLSQFKALLKSKPTAVVIVPTFIKETQQIVDQLEQLNIPYSFFNIDLDGFDNICFVGQDSYMGGYVAGKLMHLSLGSQFSFLIVQTRLDITNYHAISKRIEGFNDYFIKNKLENNTMTLNVDNLNDLDETKHKLNSFLEKHNSIRGIFVPSSRIAAIAKSINEETLKNLHLIGFDNTRQNMLCLEGGIVSFLISQKPFEQGYKSILLMSDFLIMNKKPADKIYSPIDILTKENAKYNERNEMEFQIEENNIS